MLSIEGFLYVEDKLFDRIYNEGILDVFYIWVLKVCVANNSSGRYYLYENKLGLNIQIILVNELSRHKELLACDNIRGWVNGMRYHTFEKQSSIPEKLIITFRSLLLTNLNAEIVAKHVKALYYENAMGAYLLFKIDELADTTKEQKKIKEVVKNAFILSGLNIDGYIDKLEEECHICGCGINYVQKGKMKAYLLSTF